MRGSTDSYLIGLKLLHFFVEVGGEEDELEDDTDNEPEDHADEIIV